MLTPPPPQLPKLPPPGVRLPIARRNRAGGWLSLVVHLVLLLLLVEFTRGGLWWEPQSLDSEGLDQGGGGGGPGREVTMIPLSPAPAPAAAPVVRPTPAVVPPPVPPAPVVVPQEIPPPVPAPPAVDTTAKSTSGAPTGGTGGGTGGGSGTGAGPGTGPGTGPGSGGPGTGDTVRTSGRPPEPRQLILPPFDYPKSMRGTTIQVTFFVLADGKVDHVVFGEEISDRGYAKKLENAMRAYRFRPARSAAGLPVPGHTTVSISF